MSSRPMQIAPALSAGSGEINDLVVAARTSEAERDARAKAARASYEFWNTGDEALLKRAFAENFADYTATGRHRNE